MTLSIRSIFSVFARSRAAVLALPLAALAAFTTSTAAPAGAPAPHALADAGSGRPPIGHVFLIILENQSYSNTFGATMPVPYLSKTASAAGALVPNYYGTSHFSLGNYLSLISGQAVTNDNADDCGAPSSPGFPGSNYVDVVQTGAAPYDQVKGDGCIYPRPVRTLMDQLTDSGRTWKGYMEDMGADSTREPATCGQPIHGIGAADNTQRAQVPPAFAKGGTGGVTDQYAARHNPFVYFHSLLDSGACAKNVVPLTADTLPHDLASVSTTPNFVWITPNLCDDGHDVPCKSPGSPSGMQAYMPENTFLSTWIPIITRSAAFEKDGLLIVTFDESSLAGTSASGVNVGYDGTACCGEPSGPNTLTPGIPLLAGPKYYNIPITGGPGNSGGGQIGAVLLSPFIKAGTVSMTPYNHYSALHEFEDIFGLPYLGYAAYPGTTGFGSEIFPSPAVKQQDVRL